MIDSICTPCRAISIDDVRTRLNLLRKVEGHFPRGLEVIGTISDFTNAAKRERIKNNLAECGIERLTIHSPLGGGLHSGLTNLSNTKSLEILKAVFELAHEVGAKVITAHCETFYSYGQMKSLTDKKRERLKERVAENLRKLDKSSITLSIENMPFPVSGDMLCCSTEMFFDPLFADPLELYEFAEKNCIEITLDTCHWASLGLPIKLVDMFWKIEKCVAEIHLSDCYGKWLDGVSVFKEGLIPGQGNLGDHNFRDLLSYVNKCKKNIVLLIEVKDKDMANPKESEESLGKVLNWLKEGF